MTNLDQKNWWSQFLTDEKGVIIDVRTDAEWNDGYIETAIHIPLDKILQKIEFATENKEQTIYLYCRSGKRSAKAEKSLQSIGYINAKNIFTRKALSKY